MRRAPLPAASLPAVFQDTFSRGKDAPSAAPSGTIAAPRTQPGAGGWAAPAQPRRGPGTGRAVGAFPLSPCLVAERPRCPRTLSPSSGRCPAGQSRSRHVPAPQRDAAGGPGPRLSTARPQPGQGPAAHRLRSWPPTPLQGLPATSTPRVKAGAPGLRQEQRELWLRRAEAGMAPGEPGAAGGERGRARQPGQPRQESTERGRAERLPRHGAAPSGRGRRHRGQPEPPPHQQRHWSGFGCYQL